jgi:transposase
MSAEQEEIERLVRSNDDARLVRRAQIIRLSAQGRKASEIAGVTATSVQTVHRILDLFNHEGLAGLPDKPRQGRPRKATEEYIACLKKAVAVSPRKLGYAFGSWTLERLREHLARTCDVILNSDYLSRLMARHDIVYRRPRHVMGHLRNGAEYDEKKEVLAFLKKARSTRARTSTFSSSTSVRFISTRP